jgi:hypothetical protein
MTDVNLEFRGIRLQDLGMYLEELGGNRKTNSFPFIYEGDGWSAQILREEEITFTAVFKVNAVHIRFSAENDKVMDELLKKYRYKTIRVGG